MKKILALGFLMFLLLTSASAQGNTVVSDIAVFDEGNGTGTLEIRISGNDADNIYAASVSLSGDRIHGGSLSTRATTSTRPCAGCGGNSEVILTTSFPLTPALGNSSGNEFVFVNVSAGAAIVIGNRNRLRQRPRPYLR